MVVYEQKKFVPKKFPKKCLLAFITSFVITPIVFMIISGEEHYRLCQLDYARCWDKCAENWQMLDEIFFNLTRSGFVMEKISESTKMAEVAECRFKCGDVLSACNATGAANVAGIVCLIGGLVVTYYFIFMYNFYLKKDQGNVEVALEQVSSRATKKVAHDQKMADLEEAIKSARDPELDPPTKEEKKAAKAAKLNPFPGKKELIYKKPSEDEHNKMECPQCELQWTISTSHFEWSYKSKQYFPFKIEVRSIG